MKARSKADRHGFGKGSLADALLDGYKPIPCQLQKCFLSVHSSAARAQRRHRRFIPHKTLAEMEADSVSPRHARLDQDTPPILMHDKLM